jgi:hypothetical protein
MKPRGSIVLEPDERKPLHRCDVANSDHGRISRIGGSGMTVRHCGRSGSARVVVHLPSGLRRGPDGAERQSPCRLEEEV